MYHICPHCAKELVFSNSGEAIVIHNNYTKGLVLRGYNNKDFSKLDLVKKGNLIGNPNKLIENNISWSFCYNQLMGFTLELCFFCTNNEI